MHSNILWTQIYCELKIYELKQNTVNSKFVYSNTLWTQTYRELKICELKIRVLWHIVNSYILWTHNSWTQNTFVTSNNIPCTQKHVTSHNIPRFDPSHRQLITPSETQEAGLCPALLQVYWGTASLKNSFHSSVLLFNLQLVSLTFETIILNQFASSLYQQISLFAKEWTRHHAKECAMANAHFRGVIVGNCVVCRN